MQLSKIANPGGADRDRTDDIQLAKLALSQLSYGPGYSNGGHESRLRRSSCPRRVAGTCCRGPSVVGLGRFELPTPRLSSVCSNQLSYRPLPRPLRPRISKNQARRARSLKTGQQAHSRLRTSFDLLLPPPSPAGEAP